MKTRIFVTVLLVLCLMGMSVGFVNAQGANTVSITDLGTLGGNWSSATYINDAGQIVGASEVIPGSWVGHAFLWTQENGMKDLGTLDGGFSHAVMINNLGQVVGNSDGHTFLWTKENGMQNLDSPGSYSYPEYINDLGDVVGRSQVGNDTYAFLWTKENGMQNLGGPGSIALMVNNKGQVIGLDSGHAFLWTEESGMQNIGAFVPTSINNNGQVAGVGDNHVYLWSAEEGLRDLGGLGFHCSSAYINEPVQVAGTCDAIEIYPPGEWGPGAYIPHAYLWNWGDGMRDLGTLGEVDRETRVTAINDLGQVIGSGYTNSWDTHAFLWTQDDGMQDLGTLGGNFSIAISINNKGQIVGSSNTLGSYYNHAVLWKLQFFPTTPILDDFNRVDGPLGSNWLGSKTAYRVLGNQVDVRGNGPIYWKDAFGVDQEVAVTLTTVDPAGKEQDLLLKVQGQYGPNWGEGAIEVLYNARTNNAVVWTFRPNTLKWFKYPPIPVTFSDGDQFGAQALSTGEVVIYKNGTEVGRVTLNAADQAFFNPKGGYVGLWFIDARNAFFDDFGGGDVKIVPPSYP